jgi:hypothetical protein
MHEHGSLPRARRDDLLEETVGEELLLYDQNSHTAHCLSPIAVCVWRHCDGEHNVTELAELAGVSESLVVDALRELREKDLLDAEPQLPHSAIPGISRREAIGRVAGYGAAAAAVPLVVSATAATPAMASSGEGTMCCQCYKNLGTEVCACANGFATNPACFKYCTEGGPIGCTSGELVLKKCGLGNKCEA